MTNSSLHKWLAVHTWSSLISTIFLIIIFTSGLPLIFADELEALLGYGENVQQAESGSNAPLEKIVATGLAEYPNHVVQYLVWEKDMPNVVLLSMAKSASSDFFDNFNILVNADTAEIESTTPSPLQFFRDLHTNLFIGSAGATILGLMALLLVIALISGFVVYGPHMRKLKFGEIRTKQFKRTRYLDFHNLLGAIVLGWALVVGFTGVFNGWGEYVLMSWRSGQLTELVKDYENVPIPEPHEYVSFDAAVESAMSRVSDDKELYYIAAPGSFMTSTHHYAVFLRGTTPRTEFLIHPILIDAVTGEVTSNQPFPNYINALWLSQPLHFGNYGGMPLKVIWAIFDVLTLALLITGLYLWVSRRLLTKKQDTKVKED